MTQARRKNKPSLDAIDQFHHVADGAANVSQTAMFESDPDGDTKKAILDALKQMDLDDIRDIFDQQGLGSPPDPDIKLRHHIQRHRSQG